MSSAPLLTSPPDEPDLQATWLEAVCQLPAKQRIALIEQALASLTKVPTAQNVFHRKALLRLRDSSRLEAGLVSRADLQRENSPFAAMDFREAQIRFRPRVRA
jgi:hypothetical protein